MRTPEKPPRTKLRIVTDFLKEGVFFLLNPVWYLCDLVYGPIFKMRQEELDAFKVESKALRKLSEEQRRLLRKRDGHDD